MTSVEKTIFKVKEAAARLHGSDFTESDINRLYQMIRVGEINVSRMGTRIFIPLSEIERIETPDER